MQREKKCGIIWIWTQHFCLKTNDKTTRLKGHSYRHWFEYKYNEILNLELWRPLGSRLKMLPLKIVNFLSVWISNQIQKTSDHLFPKYVIVQLWTLLLEFYFKFTKRRTRSIWGAFFIKPHYVFCWLHQLCK